VTRLTFFEKLAVCPVVILELFREKANKTAALDLAAFPHRHRPESKFLFRGG
jgi:hypothetical protein